MGGGNLKTDRPTLSSVTSNKGMKGKVMVRNDKDKNQKKNNDTGYFRALISCRIS